MKSKLFLRLIIGFAVFFVAVTYISSVIYDWSLPVVTVCFPEVIAPTKRIDTMRGTVTFTDEYEGFNAITEIYMEEIDPAIGGGWTELNDQLDITVMYDDAAWFSADGDVVSTRVDEYQNAYFTYAYTLPPALKASDGDGVTVEMKRNFSADFALPADAVRTDYLGDYILLLDIRDTAMGREVVTIREDVNIRARYRDIVSLFETEASSFDKPVVLYADRPVEVGSSVKLSYDEYTENTHIAALLAPPDALRLERAALCYPDVTVELSGETVTFTTLDTSIASYRKAQGILEILRLSEDEYTLRPADAGQQLHWMRVRLALFIAGIAAIVFLVFYTFRLTRKSLSRLRSLSDSNYPNELIRRHAGRLLLCLAIPLCGIAVIVAAWLAVSFDPSLPVGPPDLWSKLWSAFAG